MKDVKASIGKRIRELRKAKGFSQEKLSLECNLDRTYINSVENGRRNISIVNVVKIAKALGLSLKQFFDSEYFR